ncbi:tetratricopeptide repeat protein [Nonlabens ulvanivorans]|nr:hypothetical protein [Nonlabens ulvanivorans]KEZ94685.1 hypothetical protein IL45_00195 [Nonlabens ulvanivorans]PRX12117.1 hypothetical protein LY02_02797 [Nonlabens ulvanivorans]GAK77944.1 hypothetical protein JCM19296_3553 [Nonlabens ulvanivorans]
MIKKILFGFLLIGFIAIIGYNYLYQDHVDVEQSKSSASFTSQVLIELFTDQDLQNDQRALDQIIEVKGKVTNVEKNTIILDEQIFIEMVADQKLKENQLIIIKGRCLGYDELLEEVKIDQAILTN